MIDNTWYAPLAQIQSLGSLDAGPGSLAGLHEARKRHLSQFFTPAAVAKFMFDLAARAMPANDVRGNPLRYAVLDNSVGSGRLLQFCDPAVHKVGGIDVHAETVAKVKEVFEAAGFACDLHTGSMEAARPKGWSAAIINPPFSIHFETPLLKRYESNSFGKFGPGTSARSDVYALEQALDAAAIVVALLPRSVIDRLHRRELCASDRNAYRLRAIFDLPEGSFREEGADVQVSVAAFGPAATQGWVGRFKVEDLEAPPAVDLPRWSAPDDTGKARIRWVGLEEDRPTITLPVTGDKSVRVAHDGRWLKLRFGCGFTQARVMNAILVERNLPAGDQRVPKQYRYTGSSRLDLEAHVASGDAKASVEALLADIEAADATPVVAPGLWSHLARRQRRSARQAMPVAHVVWDSLPASAETLQAEARRDVLADPKSWFGWVIGKGERVTFHREADGRYVARSRGGDELRLSIDEMHRDFLVSADRPAEGWREAHPGLLRAYPELAAAYRQRALALGIDKWLTWGFQLDDLIELLLKPVGNCCAWDMGLGKTRLACALILLSGVKHAVCAMDAYLIPEFSGKVRELGIPAEDWQVIDSPEKLLDLRKINLISYERLRMQLPGSKATYAKRMRRRIGMVVADEGEILANPWSAQSSALWQLSARRRYLLSATPMPNYPRDLQPILCFTGGDGTAAQPWGFHGPFMHAGLAKSAVGAQRGVDAFRDRFVRLEWCSDAFREDNRGGAKREVPKIENLAEFRAAIAPHMKRRITQEPAVQQHVQIPEPSYMTHEVEFDDEHLGHYLAVADHFAEWWAQAQERKDRRVSSLLRILLEIGAVVRANNIPQHIEKSSRLVWSGGLTAKQRFSVDRLQELIESGEKVIASCHSPKLVELLYRELKRRGIEAIRFHGGIPIATRYEAMDRGFRKGGVPLLLGTIATMQAGMDLPQATRFLFLDRSWQHKVEAQALRRALRPQTKHEVVAEYIHHTGSLDTYQSQMVAFKRDCFRAGLDWATPEFEDSEFEHFNTILGRFLEDLAQMRGMRSYDLREQLKRLAA